MAVADLNDEETLHIAARAATLRKLTEMERLDAVARLEVLTSFLLQVGRGQPNMMYAYALYMRSLLERFDSAHPSISYASKLSDEIVEFLTALDGSSSKAD